MNRSNNDSHRPLLRYHRLASVPISAFLLAVVILVAVGFSAAGTGSSLASARPMEATSPAAPVTATTVPLWIRQAGSGIDYRSVSMYTSSDGWATGSDRGLSRWDGYAWTDFPSQSLVDYSDNTFFGVSMLDSTHVWAVGTAGMNYLYDGTSWQRGFMTGTLQLNGVAYASTNNAWAVASDGSIWHWVGTGVGPGLSWTRYPAPAVTTGGLNAISCFSGGPNGCWAAGNNGGVYVFDGSNWINTGFPDPSRTLYGIYAVDGAEVWVVGSGGSIYRFNSLNYVLEPSGTANTLYGISCGDTGECVAAGAGNTVLYRSEGASSPHASGTWSAATTATTDSTQTWYAASFTTAASPEGFVVGAPPGNTSTTAITARKLRVGGFCGADWCLSNGEQRDNQFTGLALPMSTVTSSLALAPDRMLPPSQLGTICTTCPSSGASSGALGELKPCVVFSCIDGGVISSTDSSFTGGVPFTSNITGLSLADAIPAAWASSRSPDARALLKYDGTLNGGTGGWISATYNLGGIPTAGLNDVEMLSSTSGFAVGDGGSIYSKAISNTLWTKHASSTVQNLNSVWPISGFDAWAVGAAGVAIHSTDGGFTWSSAVPITSATLNSVHCTSGGGECWTVGNSGTALRYSGGFWSSPDYTKTSDNLYGVWTNSHTDVWAVGAAGTILHFDGTSWTKQLPPTLQDLRDIKMLSATDGYISGGGSLGVNSGLFLRYTTPFASSPSAQALSSSPHVPAVSCRSAGPDNFGYALAGPGCPNAPTFNWITGTTQIPTFLNAAGTAPNVDDGWATTQVPWTYNLYGTAYTTMTISTNGWIGPDAASATTFYGEPPTATVKTRRATQVFANDLLIDFNGVYTAVSGIAPNRVFVVEWRNAHFWNTSRPGRATFEALLYEGSNDLVFQFQAQAVSGNF
ncbi:MAG: hypothetical protein ACJ78Q_00980, partial [Chloroflexia bacterium]